MTDAISPDTVFPDNIDQYPAGPELDALLAERVLGARVKRYKEEWSGYENWIAFAPDGAEYYILLSPHSVYGAAPFWEPSTNRSDAQVLVEHVYTHTDYRTLIEEITGENRYSATLWAQPPLDPGTVDDAGTIGRIPNEPEHIEVCSVTGTGPTPALALCRAVYRAASGWRPHLTEANNS